MSVDPKIEIGDVSSLISGTPTSIPRLLEDVDSNSPENIQVATEPISYLDSDGSTTGRIPNPLRDYNSYNYVITMGSLSTGEYNDPTSYRDIGFSQIIFRSGGGAYDKRVQTAYESINETDLLSEIPEAAAAAADDHAEYFIEDLEIDAVIAPNQATRVALGTTVRFKVIEPYSMGKFIESLVIAASDVGFKNYTHAPFCLRIDFVGWFYNTLQNAGLLVSSSYIPIQLVKMDFQVTDQGSVYEVEAVVYNDGVHADHINQTKTPVTVYGKTVAEILSEDVSGASSMTQSLTKVLNDRIEDLEKEKKITGYDRYVIMFPTDTDAMMQQLNNIQQSNSLSTEIDATDDSVKVDTYSSIYDSVVQLSSDTSQLNEIGKSAIIGGADTRFSESVINEQIVRNRHDPSKDPLIRQFQYSQYDKITYIIEDIITNSEYASQDDDGSGFKKWFRIQSKILLDPNPEIIEEIGRPAKIYVYMIVPSLTHEGRLVGPQQVPRGMDKIRESARKEYNYYYTGLNEDILDFKINFNNAYFNVMYSDLGMSPASPSTSSTGDGRSDYELVSSQTDGSTDNGKNEPNDGLELTDTESSTTGTRYDSANGDKVRLAKLVLDRIVNSPADMITAEIDIWGDPYFIPSDIGNYSPDIQSYALSIDNTMSYVNNEVYIIVNFKTPIDYQKNGSLMDMTGEEATFSGVYQVWGVTNIFSNGEFKQNLKLIRINKQTQEETAIVNAMVQKDGNLVPDNYSINVDTTDDLRAGRTNISEPVSPGVNDTSTPSNNVDTVEPASSSVAQAEANNPIPDQSRKILDEIELRAIDTYNQSLVKDIYNNPNYTRAQPVTGPR